jgi:hypothetical protein
MGIMNALDEWAESVCRTLDIDTAAGADRAVVLDLARDVAHGVLRPAAPLTAYLLGVAVGRGADPAEAAAKLTALASEWAAKTAS